MSKNTQRNELIHSLLVLGLYGGGHLRKFRLIYSPTDLEMPIDKVVRSIPAKKVKWAMTQVQNSLDKIQKI